MSKRVRMTTIRNAWPVGPPQLWDDEKAICLHLEMSNADGHCDRWRKGQLIIKHDDLLFWARRMREVVEGRCKSLRAEADNLERALHGPQAAK